MKSLSRFSPRAFLSKVTRLSGVLMVIWSSTGCQTESTEGPVRREVPTTASSPSSSATGRSAESAPPREALASPPLVTTQSPRVPAWPADIKAAEFTMPEVLLSAGHASTCRVGVGEVFPNLDFISLQGQPTSLDTQMGEVLTIVVFWNADQPMSVDQIRHLSKEVGEPFQSAGVSVVTVQVGNSDRAQDRLATIVGDFAKLQDPDGKAFSEVATGILPRTYVLRSDRRVLWFDMEYSRSTSRELQGAILHVLQQFERQAHHGSPSLM